MFVFLNLLFYNYCVLYALTSNILVTCCRSRFNVLNAHTERRSGKWPQMTRGFMQIRMAISVILGHAPIDTSRLSYTKRTCSVWLFGDEPVKPMLCVPILGFSVVKRGTQPVMACSGQVHSLHTDGRVRILICECLIDVSNVQASTNIK